MKEFLLCFIVLMQTAVAQWNNPHSVQPTHNVVHATFASTPKTLDPARAYSSDELIFIAQIYEPPLQYDFLKRPYTLIPLTLTEMPTITYLNQKKQPLPKNTSPNKIAYTVYDLTLKPGIYYQPHPALDQRRELTAQDYIYGIKRLASPVVHSPVLGIMQKHILGFDHYAKTLKIAYQKQVDAKIAHPFLDLRQYPLIGATALNKYHYRIILKGVYPQFQYWLAMSFFAPIPWEADRYYAQSQMQDKNITFDWQPVGTGPYVLTENNPNKQMILTKNPNFHEEKFPGAQKKIPSVDQFIFSLDKENIPRWNKFLQGYYDHSGISADSFDQAIQIDKHGQPVLTKTIHDKGIRLQTTVSPSIFYIGFNMRDSIVGGYSEKNRKLRQAIAIALDYEEYIQLFMNGRGIPAQSPIPPGIFGYESGKQGTNKIIYSWNLEKNRAQRKTLAVAKKLLAEAGYSNGINPKTGKPLVLNYDVTSSGNPDDKARFNWMRKQFEKLGIALNIRHTEYNRFQDKVRNGNAQIFSWGWLADYPDPENFLFLLYGPNSKVKFGGENATNYSNVKANVLFDEIKNLPNGKKRLAKIREFIQIVQQDSPWIWGVHPIDFTLSHQWTTPTQPHAVANNTLKYQQINPQLRAQIREQWNRPILWPLWILLAFLVVIFIPLIITYWRRENRPTVGKL